jgi:hypothetical protein
MWVAEPQSMHDVRHLTVVERRFQHLPIVSARERRLWHRPVAADFMVLTGALATCT